MKKGFTMAEVLITLGIIGIVTAMTLPTLINNHKRLTTETKLKKAYSIINQAFLAAQAENGEIKDWEKWDDAEFILKNYIAPQITNAKVYGSSGENSSNNYSVMCSDDKIKTSQYVWMTNIGISTPFDKKTASIKLMDGTCIGLNPKLEGNNASQNLFIDINGNKSTSKRKKVAGTDLFFFIIKDNSILPYGYDWSDSDLVRPVKINSCNSNAIASGRVCAALIMRNNWEITYW